MNQSKPLVLFFVFFLLFAAAIESAIVAFGFTRLLVTGLMWSVGLSAMLALKLSGQSLSSLGWGWGGARYHLIALLLPLVYGAIAYFGAAAAGLVQFATPDTTAALVQSQNLQTIDGALGVVATLALIGVVGMIGSMSTGLGEEIGWRGFLTPRLTSMTGFILATLITGMIWASWHLPILVLSDYNGGGDTRFEIASFVVMVVSFSAVFAWLRLASGSLWPAATMHASHNLFIQNIFDPLTVRGDGAITMVSEFGIVLAATVALFSIPFWIMGARRFARGATA
jgi:uncharacterized protein